MFIIQLIFLQQYFPIPVPCNIVLLYSLHLHTKSCQSYEDKKTTLHYQRKCHHDSPYLASVYMRSRTTTLLASEELASHCDIRLATCLRANVRLAQETHMLASSLSNNKSGSIFRWCSNNEAAFRILPFEYTLRAKNKANVARQTPPYAPPNIICCSCTFLRNNFQLV